MARMGFEGASYILVGDSHPILNCAPIEKATSLSDFNVYRRSKNMVFVQIACRYSSTTSVHSFELDKSFRRFEFQQTITVPELVTFTTVYRGRFVFAVLPPDEPADAPKCIDCVAVLDDETGALTKLSGTALKIAIESGVSVRRFEV